MGHPPTIAQFDRLLCASDLSQCTAGGVEMMEKGSSSGDIAIWSVIWSWGGGGRDRGVHWGPRRVLLVCGVGRRTLILLKQQILVRKAA
jgi:hypothetical protein